MHDTILYSSMNMTSLPVHILFYRFIRDRFWLRLGWCQICINIMLKIFYPLVYSIETICTRALLLSHLNFWRASAFHRHHTHSKLRSTNLYGHNSNIRTFFFGFYALALFSFFSSLPGNALCSHRHYFGWLSTNYGQTFIRFLWAHWIDDRKSKYLRGKNDTRCWLFTHWTSSDQHSLC